MLYSLYFYINIDFLFNFIKSLLIYRINYYAQFSLYKTCKNKENIMYVYNMIHFCIRICMLLQIKFEVNSRNTTLRKLLQCTYIIIIIIISIIPTVHIRAL